MDLIAIFEQYASDFDRSVLDDDWDRIRRYFADDAVREEHMPPIMSFRHVGIDTIVSEWRSMVAHFDRQFDWRQIVKVRPTERNGNVVTFHWVGIYTVADAPSMIGEGMDVAKFDDAGRIRHLESKPTADTIERDLKWASAYGQRVPRALEWMASIAPASGDPSPQSR